MGNVQLNSGLRMNRWIFRLLVTAVALCGVGETRLHSSKIVFPPTQIGPLDNPFSNPQFTILRTILSIVSIQSTRVSCPISPRSTFQSKRYQQEESLTLWFISQQKVM